MYKSNDVSTFILRMIDFPSRKRHFNVLFIYTMAAHVPRHRLRHVFLFCVYSHFSEIATFFCPRWTYERGCWVIPNLKFLKKKIKKYLKKSIFFKKNCDFSEFWENRKKITSTICFRIFTVPTCKYRGDHGQIMGRSWADIGR